MKAWKALAVGCSMIWASLAGATILPPNNLNLQDSMFRRSNVTEAKFNELIDQLENVYAPVFQVHGATLEIVRNWTNSTVNAGAEQVGNQWKVHMYGGLARRAEVTPDGFALVICHEIGHHLAGFAFYEGTPIASEGESDYFATQACAKLIWGDQDEANARYRDAASANVKKQCDAIYNNNGEQNLCYRTVMAGESLARLLLSLEGGTKISTETPSQVRVLTTSEGHPPAQCRLDTYLAGSVCEVEFPVNEIPATWPAARQVSCSSATGYKTGLRPLCWFAPPAGER